MIFYFLLSICSFRLVSIVIWQAEILHIWFKIFQFVYMVSQFLNRISETALMFHETRDAIIKIFIALLIFNSQAFSNMLYFALDLC